MKPSVSVIVLNYNGREHLGPCLESLRALDYPQDRVEIVVCDNNSSDGSVEYVGKAYPWVRVVALDVNHGFAEGNNRAVREVDSEFVAFLNNDMRVQPSWLTNLVAAIGVDPDVVCVSSKILSWDGELIDFIGAGVNFQGFGFHFDHGLRASPKDRSGRIFCPCGGAMLIRRDVFLEVGGFDGDYFSFYEDTDLGWRLNLFGHTVWYASDAIVFHRHHGSFDRIHAHRRRVLYERNALFTMYKCLDDANLAVALPASLLLLNEKALSMARLDIGGFLMNAAPPPAVVDAGEQSTESHAAKIRRVLADEGPLAVVERAAWIPLRRWRRWRSQQRRSIRPGRDFPMPLAALACLVGLSEFGRSLDALKVKRTWVQARRQRSDEEILPLFYFALEPSYHEDPAYIDFHWHVVRALGLDRRFGRGHLHRPA